MLTKEKIQLMVKEMGLDKLNGISRFDDFDKWEKLASGPTKARLHTVIDIRATTTVEADQRREHGELGGNPK